jgi:hypothetical protein
MIFDIIFLLFITILAFKVGEYRGAYKAEKNKPILYSKHKSVTIYYLQQLIRSISDSVEDYTGFPETIEDKNKRYDIECLESAMDFLSRV